MSLGLNTLGLNNDAPPGAFAPEPRHKSAGLAFAFSLLVPGTGQFYCGKAARGGLTLGFWLVGLILGLSRATTQILGLGILLMTALWIFSFLDAFFTAIEVNQGEDEQVDVQNPRVAVILNLLTAGFGYFYLGERTKGITIFVVTQVSRLAFSRTTGFANGLISASLIILQVAMAIDAYRIARRQLKEALGPEAAPVNPNAPPPSRLPVQGPVALACVLVFGLVVLIGIGLGTGKKRSAKLSVPGNKHTVLPSAQSESNRYAALNENPVPVVDFATAVQDVQRLERKSTRMKDDLPGLKQDVRMFSTFLAGRKIDGTDSNVAHYYRAVSLAMIGHVHEHEGEAIDLAEASTARSDLDKVINAGQVLTYVPEVNVTNAQYWAGSVARNQLHDQRAAYGYWEKCAWNLHAGCMNNLARARVTGAGGEKIDLQEALTLHSSVYNTGSRFHCAGAFSAMSIAEINYFTGVRRPGDDELEWTKKADDLLDNMETAGNNRNDCQRASIEVDEFLFELALGHRDDNILQDALSRLDDDSKPDQALIQFISGAIDEAGFNAAMNSSKSQSERCSAYFDAMWYAELRGEGAMAKRYHQHLVDIGTFHCASGLVYANKFKF